MSQEELREKFVADVTALYADGFQVKDLLDTLEKAMVYVGQFKDWDGLDKKAEVLAIIELVLRGQDLPGPDVLTRPVVMYILPGLVDKFFELAKEKFGG